MLYLLVPWTAANLVDFFFVRRGHYAITELFKLDGIYGRWGWRGLTAYGARLRSPRSRSWSSPTSTAGATPGFMAKALDGVDIAWIVGLIVSGGSYWLLTRSLDVERERRRGEPASASWWRSREGAGPRGVGALRAADSQLPEPVGDQVRVRLTASGVCHSDLHALDGDWTVPLPLVLGHEGAGVVEAIGPDVRDVAVGESSCCRGSRPAGAAALRAGRPWLCTGTTALEHPSR